MARPWQNEMVCVVVLVVLTGIAYGFLWRPGHVPYSKHSDIVAQHIATKTVAYRNWQAGRGLPTWRSDQNCGGPALTHPQTLYTNPFHFLFFFLPPVSAIGGTLWIQFLAMAVAFYILGGVMGLGYWARLFMAVAGLFNFKLIMMAYAGWLPVIPGLILTPLFVATIFYLLRKPGLGSALALAATGTLCLHSGNLQIFYCLLLFVGAYVLVCMAHWFISGQRAHAIRVLVCLFVGTALAVAITAYLFLPLAAEAPLTSRVKATYDFFIGDNPLVTKHFLTFLYPEALGSPIDGTYARVELWEHVAYFGLIPLALAMLGTVTGWDRRHTRFLAIGLIFSVYLTVDSKLTHFLFDYFSGYSLFRGPNRFLFVTSIFGIALGGIGADRITQFLTRWRHKERLSATIMLVMIAVMIGEGLYYVDRYLHTVSHDVVAPETKYQNYLLTDPSVFRIAPASRECITYGWAAPMGLELITGFDAYNLNHYQEYFDLLEHETVQPPHPRVWTDLDAIRRWDLLAALNVKYLASRRPLASLPTSYELVSRFEHEPVFVLYEGIQHRDIYLYRNNQALGRAFWSNDIVRVEDKGPMIEQMKTHDLRTTAIVLDMTEPPVRSPASTQDQVRVLHAFDGHLSVETRSSSHRFLMISEIWHPGWQARLDDKPIELYQTNLALMGTWIPPGTHQLVLTFRPLYWSIALTITLVGLTIFVILIIYMGYSRLFR